ncbi:breast cancer anti-estrogen resistance protein 3 homolog isoform X3 [Ruditapes philippinarum]|uniref:breast cancer anti-estrogen resistance protein 3 homolog isoform X3 n=1 Tax=Ruditapes philippinarum TaxID=129788 RepID=UPI00295BCF46|nr:breast cancer anti-estrogen resistance protein 3 homolog isoform X3 [Ruditapes philippinarum]
MNSSNVGTFCYVLVLEKHHQNNMATRHIAVETWLEALGMMEYVTCFSQYNGVENLLYMSEGEIKDLGVKNAAHRAKIVSSLRILREKYERSTLPGKKNSPLNQVQRSQSVTAQLSPNWSPPSLVNSPDYQQVNVSPEKLQHDLIVELQGDPADLKSKAWYHGSISRQRAERLVFKNGDFLVRDCISQPGDFVLTCCWKGGPLHFVINSSVIDQGPYKLPKVTYHFEATHFNSVQDLIQHYMDECKQITEITGAVITTPIGRSMPLTYYDSKYGALAALSNAQANHYSTIQLPNQQMAAPVGHNQPFQRSPHITPGTSPRSSPQGTPKVSPHGTPGASPHGSPKPDKRHRFGERSGSQPLLSVNDIPVYTPPGMDRSDSLPVITNNYKQVTPTHDYPDSSVPEDSGIYKTVTPVTTVYTPPTHPAYFHQRSGSAPVLTPGVTVTQHFGALAPPTSLNPASSDSDLSKAPPPKPSRIPSVKYKKKPQVQIRNKALYEDDYRDYSDYNQVTSEPSWLKSVETNQQTDNKLPSNQTQGENDYDNNFNQSKNVSHERDLNQNLALKSDNRKISDTRFNILDGEEQSDIPAFPLELNLNRDQIRAKQQQQQTADQSRRQGVHLPSQISSQTQNVHHTKIKIPKIETVSSFNLNLYTSVLLPNENRLLEPSSLINVREKLLKTSARLLAQYLTKADLEMLKVLNEEDLGVKVTSGLELITLPQGKQLRQDILERIYSLKAFVMVMILTCPKVIDRAAMLSQWIQIAMETKGTLGNLFGFENVMEGLMSDQIQRLRDTWMVLRQNHTSSAFLFDTKLKSAFRMLHDGSGSLPVQDVCIPGINPIVQLLERTVDDESYFPWESSDIKNGLDTMLCHLDLARVVTAQCGVYRVTGNTVIKGLEPDQEKLEMFQTEFYLRFLWGFKGAGVARAERHNKFIMLLTAYSEKIEKEGDDGTAV